MEQPGAEIAELYRTAGPALWAHLRRKVDDPHAAEELFQETFLAAAENPAGLQAAASPRAWLFGIARNLVLEHLRRYRLRRTTPLPEDLTQPAERDGDELAAMRAAIVRLPEGQREVLELRLRDQLSYAEIAEALGLPIGTVRSRLHHAIGALKDWAARQTPGVGTPARIHDVDRLRR